MNLVQFKTTHGGRAVAAVEGGVLRVVDRATTVYGLALAAVAAGEGLEKVVAERLSDQTEDYEAVIAEQRLLTPLDHPDPAHLLVTGTGLTHLGSAATRDAMHVVEPEKLTDSMKMFKMGIEGGKPGEGEIGVQPEWFYKGDGGSIVPPEAALDYPGFAEDGGEEPEICGLYLIGPDGTPWRLGFALGNEYSDHVTERVNYLWLAHSKLRTSSFGPELRIGALPDRVEGTSSILRGGKTLWSKPFVSGEDAMSHTLANLEHHHFKYDFFRRPGDVHVHYFGTATLSFADGIKAEPGDVFEIQAEPFGRPLRNLLGEKREDRPVLVRSL
ncbi:MAG TPA: AraD1 family protein [Geminicoccus sp.]|uniref:AraD1 family protein n=1 Tax=Geminicoccus sp. TaxID=2024832 RepID=UPI002C9CE84D|nr:AraD1 family protein [Geminicoccus sp.]HWL67991.1 AraD1 family protein [Geminicoccus sp.]